MLLAALVLLAPGGGRAEPRDGMLCSRAIRAAERVYGLPERLLLAIAITETGRRIDGTLAPWPWSINADGEGTWLDDRAAAIARARALRAQGVESIDVGCMQVNLKWHQTGFDSLEAAFDPRTNVDYAARHLKALRAHSRSWLEAAGRYHSWDTDRAKGYLARLRVNWRAALDGTDETPVLLPDAPGRIAFDSALVPVLPTDPRPGLLAGLPRQRLLTAGQAPLVSLSPGPGALAGVP